MLTFIPIEEFKSKLILKDQRVKITLISHENNMDLSPQGLFILLANQNNESFICDYTCDICSESYIHIRITEEQLEKYNYLKDFVNKKISFYFERISHVEVDLDEEMIFI